MFVTHQPVTCSLSERSHFSTAELIFRSDFLWTGTGQHSFHSYSTFQDLPRIHCFLSLNQISLFSSLLVKRRPCFRLPDSAPRRRPAVRRGTPLRPMLESDTSTILQYYSSIIVVLLAAVYSCREESHWHLVVTSGNKKCISWNPVVWMLSCSSSEDSDKFR